MSAGVKPAPDAKPSPGPLDSLRSASLALLTSAALLVPCFWQPHIQAGDLSSHLYTAWLAPLVRSGSVPGLVLKAQWTNVLVDWLLERLLSAFGVVIAERAIASLVILTFFWGAFRFIETACKRRPWALTPVLAMLSYGVVFHLGFLNHLLSTGLCLWAMSLLWDRFDRIRGAFGALLLFLGLLAHALPVIWAAAVLVYFHGVRRTREQWRPAWLLGGLAGLLFLRTLLGALFPSRWTLDQIGSLEGIAAIAGVDQVWLYGIHYLIPAGVLLAVWCYLFLDRLDDGGILHDPLAQLWVLQVAAIVLLPSSIQLPQYQHILAYIPQRLSLYAGLMLCAVAGGKRLRRRVSGALAVASGLFFVFLFLDDAMINTAESRVATLFETLPPNQRVVAAVGDPQTRLSALVHVADRLCIGRCYSYGNYEPATGQFRIRIDGSSPYAAPTMEVVQAIEDGRHIVTKEEAPLYSVCECGKDKQVCLRALKAGERTCSFSVHASMQLADFALSLR